MQQAAAREELSLTAMARLQALFQLQVGRTGNAGPLDVSEEKLTSAGGREAAYEIGIVKIVAGKVAELLGDVFVLTSDEVWNSSQRRRSAEIEPPLQRQEV